MFCDKSVYYTFFFVHYKHNSASDFYKKYRTNVRKNIDKNLKIWYNIENEKFTLSEQKERRDRVNIKFEVAGQRIVCVSETYIASGSVNCWECMFDFSEEWLGYEICAMFISGESKYAVPVENGRCIIPHEVLKGTFGVSVYGISEEEDYRRITSDIVYIDVFESGWTESELEETTLSIHEEMLRNHKKYEADIEKNAADIDELRERVDEIAENYGIYSLIISPTRKDYSYAFSNWNAARLAPPVINADNVMYMFYNCGKLLDGKDIEINITSSIPKLIGFCQGCSSMRNAPKLNFTNKNAYMVTTYKQAYCGCISLENAEIWLGDGTMCPEDEESTDMTKCFDGCMNLENVTFCGSGIASKLDLSASQKITAETMQSLCNALMDVSEEEGTYSFTVSSATNAIISDELRNTFTAKGWTIGIK